MVPSVSHGVPTTCYTSCIQIYTQSWCYGKSSTWTLGLDGLSVRCTQASSDIILALFLHHSATVLSVMTQNNYGKERFDFNLHFFLITDYHWGKVKGETWRQDFLSLHTALLLNKILSHSKRNTAKASEDTGWYLDHSLTHAYLDVLIQHRKTYSGNSATCRGIDPAQST